MVCVSAVGAINVTCIVLDCMLRLMHNCMLRCIVRWAKVDTPNHALCCTWHSPCGGMLQCVPCGVLHLLLPCVMQFVSSLPRVSGHEACEVHRVDVIVEVSQEAEEEGEMLAARCILRTGSML